MEVKYLLYNFTVPNYFFTTLHDGIVLDVFFSETHRISEIGTSTFAAEFGNNTGIIRVIFDKVGFRFHSGNNLRYIRNDVKDYSKSLSPPSSNSPASSS